MHLIRGSTWFQIVNVRLASLEWILCNAKWLPTPAPVSKATWRLTQDHR